MEYNKCSTCGAGDGRCGLLINSSPWKISECVNCNKTRKTGVVFISANLQRTDEELQLTMNILNYKVPSLELWKLDYTGVEGNSAVSNQGVLICIKTKQKGFFSPILERYPSRQDLAIKTKFNREIV